MRTPRPTARIRLRLELGCPPEAAWRAIHSPVVAASVYAPVVVLSGLDPLPERWREGDSAVVRSRILGLVPFGTQRITVRHAVVGRTTDRDRDGDGTATLPAFVDAGQPLTGPLALLATWDHRMWVEPVAGHPDRTIWHDALTVGGRAAPLMAVGLRMAWWLRGVRLKRLAREWR